MYSPDTLERLNDEAVEKYEAMVKNGKVDCDFCGNTAVHTIPVYNPADSVRGVEGAYNVYNICDECYDNRSYLEENFYCEGCGELFVTHHSWDSLVCNLNGGMYCHECAAEEIEPIEFSELIEQLQTGETSGWARLDNIPDKEEVWSGEYSGGSDFSGHTNFESIVKELYDTGLEDDDLVYPVVTKTYQFSVVLGVYK